MTDSNAAGAAIPKSLFIFSLVYGGLVVLAGVLGTKIANIGPLNVESGIFAFLMLVVLSSAVAELHGKSSGGPTGALWFHTADSFDGADLAGDPPAVRSLLVVTRPVCRNIGAGRADAVCGADFLRHFADIECLCLHQAEGRRQRTGQRGCAG